MKKPLETASDKKTQKRKKPIALFVLLGILAVIVLLIGLGKWSDYMASKQLEKLAVTYPFTFSKEGDSLTYVTGDFTVTNHKVKWKSNSKAIKIKGDSATVTREENSKSVLLTETHRFFMGKAKRTYTCIVIGTKVLNSEEIMVVTPESVRDGSYEGEMEISYDTNGNLCYMYGDFGDVRIQSREDAVRFAEAYKTVFQIAEQITFTCDSNNATERFLTYKLCANLEDYEIANETLLVTVDKNNFKPVKITSNITCLPSALPGIGNYDYKDIVAAYFADGVDFAILSQKSCWYQANFCEHLVIIREDYKVYSVWVDNGKGEVVSATCDEESLLDFSMKRTDASCSGKTELNKNVQIDGSHVNVYDGDDELITNYYIMTDASRDIMVFKNSGDWDWYVEINSMDDPGIIDMLKGIISYQLANDDNHIVMSSTKKFDDAIASESYEGIRIAYDYYAANFDRYSYDGENASIYIYTNWGQYYDNASWCSSVNEFHINPTSYFAYSLAVAPEVLGHEYTHAVFDSMTSLTDNAGVEVRGINEGYADVMGCIMNNRLDGKFGKNQVADTGETIYLRDDKNYNGEDLYGGSYSEKYYDAYWLENNGECHSISTLISHVACAMWDSKLFTPEDVASIYYNSLALGYNDSSTMLDARRNLIQTADTLGYSKECQDFIAYQFDLEEIYDAYYEITTPDYEVSMLVDYTAGPVFRTDSDAIDGHPLLDDKTLHSYIVFFSPIGVLFADTPVCIMEAKQDYADYSEADIQELLQARFDESLATKDTNLNIKVEYYQIPAWGVSVCKNFLIKSENQIKSMAAGAIGVDPEEDNEIIDLILLLSWNWYCVESTAYDFYNGL